MAYVYRHIRLDKNEVFYVGISKKENGYVRAHDKRDRNRHWTSIVKKTPIEVEIVMDNISMEEAKQKEIEFISLYKRKSEGGTLVNLTLGGDGGVGYIVSAEQRAKISAVHKGKTSHRKGKKLDLSPETRAKMSASKKGKSATWLKGKKQTPEHIAKIRASVKPKTGKDHYFFGKSFTPEHIENLKKGQAMRLANGGSSWNKGIKLDKEKYGDSIDRRTKKLCKSIIQLTPEGRMVGWFSSIAKAREYLKCSGVNLIACLKGRRKEYRGFIFLYYNEASMKLVKC